MRIKKRNIDRKWERERKSGENKEYKNPKLLNTRNTESSEKVQACADFFFHFVRPSFKRYA